MISTNLCDLMQVATIDGLNVVLDSELPDKSRITDIPINLELLLTTNSISLLETENPQHQAVVEVSPLNVILSEERLRLIKNVSSSLDFGAFDDGANIKKRVKPDPPRIEILSRRILQSIDVSCNAVKLAIVKDVESEGLTLKHKELVMEECLSDFLSVVSCFDFNLPNEEALSSAMQISIGRLVGIGLTDDEAWGCTNAARLNFLDGIALMRRAQTDLLVQLSGSMGLQKDASHDSDTDEESSDRLGLEGMDDFVVESVSSGGSGSDSELDSDEDGGDRESLEDADDDDSADSADIVETTLGNAVEKTLSTFAQLLQPDDFIAAEPILVVELPLGARVSTVKLFYDKYLTSSIPSLVMTNSVGIELLTIVPSSPDDTGSSSDDLDDIAGNGISFSRFDFDKDCAFGEGGAPMSILASDEGAEHDRRFRDRAKFDETDLGEVEVLFSSKIFENLIEEISKLKSGKGKEKEKLNESPIEDSKHVQEAPKRPEIDSSSVIMSSSLSVLMTSDELVPFTRLTAEDFAFRNQKAAYNQSTRDDPSWSVIASSVSLENLSPEGQFYPEAITLLHTKTQTSIPFQIRFYKSPDPWKVSNRLVVDFRGYRVHLVRQYLNELIHFLISDRFGVGRLKKKYSTDQRDIFGNGKPPLLYSVNFMDSSVVLPRSSSSSDLVAFEVEKVSIAVSYIPETFAMPTESTPFEASPSADASILRDDTRSRQSFMSDSDDYDFENDMDMSQQGSEPGEMGPISSHTSNLKKRLTIKLGNMRVFTSMAPNQQSKSAVESPLFRFFHELDGRAEAGKLVYRRRKSSVRQSSADLNSNVKDALLEQVWEEMSTNTLNLQVLADWAPHMRLLIGDWESPLPFSLNARLSQFCLLLSVWYTNMQEFPAMFPNSREQVKENSTPPELPKNFPNYATEEFVAMLEDISDVKSEICCIFNELKLRCTFDAPGYFEKDPECFQYFADPYLPQEERPGIIARVCDATIHVLGDRLNMKRIGVGSSGFELVDERREAPFQRVLSTNWANTTTSSGGSTTRPSPAWADISWGLRTDVRTLEESLPMPFQVTCFMTPEWALINVGGESVDAVMFELSWIWVFLGYFKSYFKEPEFGNLGHQAERWVHRIKNSLRKSYGQEPTPFEPGPGINVDFRLWLCKPILSLPSEYKQPESPSLRINCKTGLWYRYKSIQEFSSQEVATTDINLYFVNEFEEPSVSRNGDLRNSMTGVRPVIEGLSFGLRYDCNNSFNHKDITVLIPYAGERVPSCSVTGGELEVAPMILDPPTVCTPFKSLERSLGPKVCEITCIVEVLPVVSSTMLNFFKGPEQKNEEFVPEEIDQGPATISVSAQVGDMRIFAIDPILGVQLPVAVLSIRSLQLTLSKYSTQQEDDVPRGDSPPGDFQVAVDSHIWADYFKLGITRSWEPLIEPFRCLLLRETSQSRGQGFSLDADSPFHVNLTGAFLQNLSEIVESFTRVVDETFGKDAELKRHELLAASSPSKARVGAIIEDSIKISNGTELDVLHEIPKPLKGEDRVAFSLRNLTGQKVRVHQQADDRDRTESSQPPTVTYLNEFESMGLTFAATISVIKNLSIVEVPYPGLPDSTSGNWNQGSLKHAVDVQVPGFRWLEGIKVDTFGRKFEPLIPRSSDILSKVYRDWRLKNVLMLLTEVGLDSGGRLVTVRSLFEIRNDSVHKIKLVFNPDPAHKPKYGIVEKTGMSAALIDDSSHNTQGKSQSTMEEIAVVEPGEVFQVPILLLERALHLTGSHLGCFWICPEIEDQESTFLRSFKPGKENTDEHLTVGFCSRPVQLAKLVDESAVIFQNGGGADISVDKAKSGVQVSCPTRINETGDTDAPFCYAIEVGRSPLVNINREQSMIDTESKDQEENDTIQLSEKKTPGKSSGVLKKASKKVKIHGPVAYTLSVHAPLVVVNLLPEGGRFELMHAVRKTVLWYADLQPGQQIPVHSVGLDAPLLLLVNLGFCRTPVGEGALVHHGTDTKVSAKGRLHCLSRLFGMAFLAFIVQF